jgi:hypothetical protein
MTAVFLERAFWAFLALVSALLGVVYKLFNGSLNLKLENNKINIKKEIKEHCEEKINTKFIVLESKIHQIKKELDAEKVERLQEQLDNFRKK